MSTVKAKGSKICTRAYTEGKLDYNEYSAVMDAISEIDTLADRDVELRGLWERARTDKPDFYVRRTDMEMRTMEERDRILENLWDEFADVLFDEDEDGRLILSEPWNGFCTGTEREEIWHWFDERYSKGVYALLYGEDDCSYE